MITIKDVAEQAGVSPSTASRALRQIGYISKETHERVFQAASNLGYIAYAGAQQLKKNTVKTVGFILSDSSNEYYFGILADIQRMLNENNMNLIIAFSSENPKDEASGFRSLIASRVSYIFFTPTSDKNYDIIQTAKKNGIKVVQLFRDIYPELDSIVSDDESGCRQAAEKLLELGCRRLLLIDIKYPYLDSEKVRPDRSTGFLKALQNRNVQNKILRFPLFDYDTSVLEKAIISFAPDGIIAGTNVARIEVLFLLKHKLPKSIRLIVFDDNRWLDLISVSAIHQDSKDLTNKIRDIVCIPQDEVRKLVFPQHLIVRNQCYTYACK